MSEVKGDDDKVVLLSKLLSMARGQPHRLTIDVSPDTSKPGDFSRERVVKIRVSGSK